MKNLKRMKTVNLTVFLLFLTIAAYAQTGAITGTMNVCPGSTTSLSDTTPGGVWTSANTAIATVGSSGMVSGVSAGAVNITYAAGPGYVTASVTVNALPGTVFCSAPAICSGSTTLVTDGTPGGTWSSSNPAVVTIGTGGTTVGVAAGTANISYGVSGCFSTKTMTVQPTPMPFLVTGGGSYCAGGTGVTVGLNASQIGINYQLFVGAAPVGSALPGFGGSIGFGLQTTAGTYIILATNAATGCIGNMTGSAAVSINRIPSPIAGSSIVCGGATIPLSDTTTGGTWSSGSPGIATVSGIGAVTGLTPGTVVIDYTLSGCSTSKTVTVDVIPADSVTGGGSYCAGGSGVPVGLGGSVTGVDYQLSDGSTHIGLPLSGTGLALYFGSEVLAGTYTVKATSTYGCTSSMGGSATVSVLPTPLAFAVTGGGGYCPGSPGAPVRLASSQTGATYQLMLGSLDVGGPFIGTGSSIYFGMQTTPGSYTVLATLGGCNGVMTGSAAVSLYPAPTTYLVAPGGGYCAGGTGVAVSLAGSEAGVTYRLYEGSSLYGSMSGTGLGISFGPFPAGTYIVTAANTTTGCTDTMAGSSVIVVNPLPAVYTVTGGGAYCAGGSGVHVGLSNSDAGINYRLFDGTTAVSSLSGTGSSIDFGPETPGGIYKVVATNTSTGCVNNMADSAIVSIIPTVTPSVSISLSPGDTVCAGSVVAFAASPVNGGFTPIFTWSVNGVIATTGGTYSYIPLNGDIVSLTMISSATCATPPTATHSVSMTVKPDPVITGDSTMCVGGSVILTSASGSTWFSSVPTVATIGTFGTITGVLLSTSPGTTVVTCWLSGCYSTLTVTVNPLPTVSVTSTVSCGGVNTLTAGGAGTYLWSPTTGLSCPTCASTDANPASSTIYTATGTLVTGCSDTSSAYVDANRICGYISYGSSPYNTFKVWLMQINPIDSTITAEDSMLNCTSGGAPYYQFNDAPPGTYFVRAALLGQPADTIGFVPTYGLNTPHWYAATGIAHGYANDSMHIDMAADTVPSGPGFIGGYISMGAGSGTSGFIPAPGVLVFLEDIHNVVRAYTYTDASGNYSFPGVALNGYIVFPEDYGFNTTPSGLITLSSTADSAKKIDFKIYTASRIIVPVSTGLNSVTEATGLVVYPNPSAGNINIRWGNLSPTGAKVLITDMLGQEVYRTVISSNTAETQITPGLQNGVYLLTIEANGVSESFRLLIIK